MKIRELIEDVQDINGVVFTSGAEVAEYALRMHLAKGRVSGGLAFANIYDRLRAKGFSQAESIKGALEGSDHIVRLEATARTPAVSASSAAIDVAKKLFEDAMFGGPVAAPTFEDSLNDHQRQCALCREQELKKWNDKQGAK